jgi:murein DD-endopeptidase MepM/ murein hydrolase activator NlpD
MRRIVILASALGGLLLAAAVSLRPDAATGPAANAGLGAGGPVEHLPPAPPLIAEPSGAVAETSPAGPALGRRLELRIGDGQVFYQALADLGVPHEDIMSLVKSVLPFRDLRKVRRGEVFRVDLSVRDQLEGFGFDLDLESWVRYVRTEEGGFEQELGTYPVERRTVGVGGVIESSLYACLQQSGAPLDLAAKMNDVLGWDLDFSRDPRRGDAFRIVYEEVWKDGEFVRTGPILACSYAGGGRDLAAYRYTLRDGKTAYYGPEGQNLQKQLMRAPLNYSRISSGFSYNRRHPVLGRNMPHLGIDYAAPVGTPIWAAGDGTVAEMGRKTGNGRYVRIRHTNRQYETYYLHLSRFAKGLRQGGKVRQGDVIGYVGATGYATGPHLDYRVKKSGQFVNPRTLRLPAAAPVPGEEAAGFAARRRAYDLALADLDASSTEPAPVVALDMAGAPWWDARVQAALTIPSALRAPE